MNTVVITILLLMKKASLTFQVSNDVSHDVGLRPPRGQACVSAAALQHLYTLLRSVSQHDC